MAETHPLKSYRKENGLSQEALAEKLGVDRLTVHRWETNKRRPGKDHLPKIMEVTGISARELRSDLAELLGAAP